MLKKLLTTVFLTAIVLITNAQVAINNDGSLPHGSAILDVKSIDKGFLLPRMNSAQRIAIISPVGGLLVYDTDAKEIYHHDGSVWRKFLNSNFWQRSSTRSWMYSIGDSVGISTSSPDYRFHVNSGSIYLQDNRNAAVLNPHLIFDVPAVNFKEAGLQFTRSGDTLAAINYIANPNTPNYIKLSATNTGRSPDLVINSSGYTGLGISNPQVKFHLYDRLASEVMRLEAENPMIQFRRRTSPVNVIPVSFADVGFIQTATNNFRIGTNSSNLNGKFVIRTGGNDHVFVDNAGNVSIGSANVASGYKVSIDGKLICEELKVQLSSAWPDYVFAKSYKLLSIPDLEKYVKQNNHLPNIPAANEIESNGLSVGDMQKRMMEKIEELTLYIFQLKKEIDSLKKL